eukprot:scaffold228_cov312-Pinguiococcus_pyrenoidosus.AAC.8
MDAATKAAENMEVDRYRRCGTSAALGSPRRAKESHRAPIFDRENVRFIKHTPPGELQSDDSFQVRLFAFAPGGRLSVTHSHGASQAKRRRLFSPYTAKMVELDEACAEEFAKMDVAEAKDLSQAERTVSEASDKDTVSDLATDEEEKLDFDLRAPRSVFHRFTFCALFGAADADVDAELDVEVEVEVETCSKTRAVA